MSTDASLGTQLFGYATSHRIDEVGPWLLRKDLSDEMLMGDAVRLKVDAAHNPAREPAVYRDLLTPAGVGPRCVSSGDDWIVLQRLAGPVLWQVSDPRVWELVAASIPGMHRRLTALPHRHLPLLAYDMAYFASCGERARRRGAPAGVLCAHARAAARLATLPTEVVHGEFYASNVIVEVTHGAVEVWPVDWEVAGLGPGVLDLAALVSGWPVGSPEPDLMIAAYLTAMGIVAHERPEWLLAISAARLQICVQWLGSPSWWCPPEPHRHDWLADAVRFSGEL